MYSNHKAPRSVSRRAVLGAAGAGAAGAAAVTLGVTKAFEEKESALTGSGTAEVANAGTAAAAPEGMAEASPIVVVLDPSTGEMVAFNGVSESPLDNRGLADAVLQAVQNR